MSAIHSTAGPCPYPVNARFGSSAAFARRCRVRVNRQSRLPVGCHGSIRVPRISRKRASQAGCAGLMRPNVSHRRNSKGSEPSGAALLCPIKCDCYVHTYYSSRMILKPPYIRRLPSNGIGFWSSRILGSSMVFRHAISRISFDGHMTQEKTTVSFSSFCTEMGNEVSSPSGTSSPLV